MRSARIVGRGAADYHCMTRVIDRKMLLDKGGRQAMAGHCVGRITFSPVYRREGTRG